MSNAIGSPAPVARPRASRTVSFNPAKWFYPGTALLLLVLAFIGFGRFYMHGRAYPDRPIHPSIKLIVIAHGITMTAWLLLLFIQPTLIAMRKHRLHMKLGKLGAALAVLICVFGLMTAVGSVRTTPPEAVIWGMHPKQFMAVPFIAIVAFAVFITLGIAYRKKPDIHRAMMLMGTLCAMSAAVSRIDPLNNLYLGTIFDRWFGPFFFTLLLGVVLFAVRCALARKIDRPLALGLAGVIAAALFTMNIADTGAWDAFASLFVA